MSIQEMREAVDMMSDSRRGAIAFSLPIVSGAYGFEEVRERMAQKVTVTRRATIKEALKDQDSVPLTDAREMTVTVKGYAYRDSGGRVVILRDGAATVDGKKIKVRKVVSVLSPREILSLAAA